MKKSVLALLLFATLLSRAQTPPPAMAAFVSTDGGSTWNPWTSASGAGGMATQPPAIAMYCQASPPSGPWTPCAPSGGGPVFAYPPAGVPTSTGSAWGTSFAPQGTDTSLLTTTIVNGISGTLLCVDSNGGGTDVGCALPPQPASQYIGPQAIAGCGVEYVSGLSYTVGACRYSINGVNYATVATQNLTLPAADPTNPRIDAIFIDSSLVVQSIQGTPAVTPQQPVVDPSTQLQLTFVLVPAASSTPGNTTLVNIYSEGTEWTGATGGTNAARVNLTSTNNPFRGTHDTEFGNGGTVTTTTFAQYVDPAAGTVNMANYNSLVFYVRNKAAWPSTRSVTVQWYNGSTAKGTPVVISNGSFGFNSTTNTTTYQQISIPTSTFGINGTAVTTLRFTVSGSGAALTGFYLDEVTLQGGNGPVVLPTTLMNFKGAYSTTATYNPNDTVVSGGIGYVALVQNTNVAVSTAATWTALAPKTIPWSCQPGYGDGTNAVTASTYPQTGCYNDTGQTITLTGIRCFSDNNGTSTVNATNGAGTGLLTGAITCTTAFAAGTQSGTTTIAAGDFIKFSFVADGTTKQTTFVVTGNHP